MTRDEFESLPAGTIVQNAKTGTRYRVDRLVKISAHRSARVPDGLTDGAADYSARTLRPDGTEFGPYRVIPFAKVEISR